jgi:hypothetical protein
MKDIGISEKGDLGRSRMGDLGEIYGNPCVIREQPEKERRCGMGS